MDLEFEVGNHYKMLTESEVEENNLGLMLLHRWTAFIKIREAKRVSSLSKIIAYVDFTLFDGTIQRIWPCKGCANIFARANVKQSVVFGSSSQLLRYYLKS